MIKPTYIQAFEKKYLENSKSKHYLHQYLFKRLFDKFSKDIHLNRLCTGGSLVIDD